MEHLTRLTQDIYCIEVGTDGFDYSIDDGCFLYQEGNRIKVSSLPEGEFKILGICTDKEVSFDCDDYVQHDDYWYFTDEQDAFRELIKDKTGKEVTETNKFVVFKKEK